MAPAAAHEGRRCRVVDSGGLTGAPRSGRGPHSHEQIVRDALVRWPDYGVAHAGRWTVSVPDQVRARTARRGRAPRRTASPLGGGCDRRFRSHTPSAVSAPRDPQQVGRAAAGRHQHARVDSGCLRLQWPNGQEVWLRPRRGMATRRDLPIHGRRPAGPDGARAWVKAVRDHAESGKDLYLFTESPPRRDRAVTYGRAQVRPLRGNGPRSYLGRALADAAKDGVVGGQGAVERRHPRRLRGIMCRRRSSRRSPVVRGRDRIAQGVAIVTLVICTGSIAVLVG